MLSAGLFFDLDGTVADSERTHWAAWRTAVAPLGLDLTWSDYEQTAIGRSDPEFLRLLADATGGFDESDAGPILRAKRAEYARLARRSALVPDSTLRLLRHLRDIPLALVTSSPWDEVIAVLEGADLHCFTVVVTLDDVRLPKPHPEPYHTAMLRLGVTQGIAFEDSTTGQTSARAAGLSVVRIRSPQCLAQAVRASLGNRLRQHAARVDRPVHRSGGRPSDVHICPVRATDMESSHAAATGAQRVTSTPERRRPPSRQRPSTVASEISIQPASLDAVPALLQFARGLSPKSREMFAPYRWKDADLPDQLRTALCRAVDGRDALFVARFGADVIAYLTLWGVYRRYASTSGPLCIPTVGLAVIDKYHCQGVGRACLRHLISHATSIGAVGLELTTAFSNARALHLYRSEGFQTIGQLTISLGGDPSEASVPGAHPIAWRTEQHMYLPICLTAAGTAVDAIRTRAVALES